MAQISEQDKDLIDFLQSQLGEDYSLILKAFLERYKFISLTPVLVRLKAGYENPNGEQAQSFIGIDPNGPRYFYLKAAATSPIDAFNNLSRFDTIRYTAQKLFLLHYTNLKYAVDNNYFGLWMLYPAELRKIVLRYPHIFQWEDYTPVAIKTRAIAGRVTVIDRNFSWDILEENQLPINDPFALSEDDLPTDLPKPIAVTAPLFTIKREKKTSTEEPDIPVDFSAIQDANL